jgi:acyl carrier protein
MGLDAVSLVMEVEDNFGISIQTNEAERIQIVGDLVSVVHSRIIAAQARHCPMLPAFLALRTTVRDVTGDSSLRIRPRHLVTESLTVSQRRELWRRLAKMLGSPPRALRRPPPLRALLTGVVILLVFLATVTALAIDVQILPVTLALAAIAVACLHISTVPFRFTPPDGWMTFGDITTKVVGATVATKNLHLRTTAEVLAELRPIIADVLGVDLDEVVSEARFIEDLGVD